MRQKDPFQVDMGRRFREAREKKGWTRERLSEAAELSVPFLANLELGNTGIRLDRFKNLCGLLNVSADYVLFGETGAELQPILDLLRGKDGQTIEIVEKIVRATVSALAEASDE